MFKKFFAGGVSGVCIPTHPKGTRSVHSCTGRNTFRRLATPLSTLRVWATGKRDISPVHETHQGREASIAAGFYRRVCKPPKHPQQKTFADFCVFA